MKFIQPALGTAEDELRKFVGTDRDINALFFAARNGAIAYLCWEIEKYFRPHKLNVTAKWKESSFRDSAHIILTLHDKSEHCRLVFIARETVWPRCKLSEAGSECLYSLKSIQTGEYYGHRKPKKAEEFDAILASDEFAAFIEPAIYGVNYPFTRESYSSF